MQVCAGAGLGWQHWPDGGEGYGFIKKAGRRIKRKPFYKIYTFFNDCALLNWDESRNLHFLPV